MIPWMSVALASLCSYHHGHQDHRPGHHGHGHHEKKHGHPHAGAADSIADRLLPVDSPKTTTDTFYDAPGLPLSASPFLPTSIAGADGDSPLMPRAGSTPTRPLGKTKSSEGMAAGGGEASSGLGIAGKPPRYSIYVATPF